MPESEGPTPKFTREGILICPDCRRSVTEGRGCNNCMHNAYRDGDNPLEPNPEAGYEPPKTDDKK